MKLYNTLTRQKEEFVPAKAGVVTMYSCGPTVYNFFHIGNARPFIVFDALRRYLRYRGYDVRFVQNFTDIDDKLISRANETGMTLAEVADTYIREYEIDARGLGIEPADVHPRVTENIDGIIEMVSALVEKDFAYEADGDVYYRTRAFEGYGKLSHQPLEDIEAGARVEVGERKENPMDFALWKRAKEGEPAWPSPWGMGRPGWHIECSVMANRFLGATIDIHSGGQDLIFPHHENEIAQSEAANGVPFARFWLHNGYINVDNQKMSKSKGNFFTVREAAKAFGYDAIRFFMLSAHYRSPINYSADILEQAAAGLSRIRNCLENLEFLSASARQDERETDRAFIDRLPSFREAFIERLDDDFNTADAVAVIFDLVREANAYAASDPSASGICAALAMLRELCGVIGVPADVKKDGGAADQDERVDALIERRQKARARKDFKEADAIRDELRAMGIVLEDTPAGVRWHRQNTRER